MTTRRILLERLRKNYPKWTSIITSIQRSQMVQNAIISYNSTTCFDFNNCASYQKFNKEWETSNLLEKFKYGFVCLFLQDILSACPHCTNIPLRLLQLCNGCCLHCSTQSILYRCSQFEELVLLGNFHSFCSLLGFLCKLFDWILLDSPEQSILF